MHSSYQVHSPFKTGTLLIFHPFNLKPQESNKYQNDGMCNRTGIDLVDGEAGQGRVFSICNPHLLFVLLVVLVNNAAGSCWVRVKTTVRLWPYRSRTCDTLIKSL